MKSVKKLLTCAIIAVSAAPIMVCHAAVGGGCGSGEDFIGGEYVDVPADSMVWEYDEATATLTISGTGYMGKLFPWNEYADKIRHVIVGDGVKSIGDGAFTQLENMETLEIADSVEKLEASSKGGGVYAKFVSYVSPFCKNEENWENGILYAGNYVVSVKSDELVGSCAIRPGTRYIPMAAFGNPSPELESLIIPDSVVTIDSYNFIDYPKLKTLKLPSGAKEIRFQTYGCMGALETLVIPEGAESMTYSFWKFPELREVYIPASMTFIEGCFDLCEKLTDVYYAGTQEQWNGIATDKKYDYDDETGEEILTYTSMSENAAFAPEVNIHFNAEPPVSVLVNGNSIEFDRPPIIEDGRALVPLRAIFEAMGAAVEWDGTSQTVTATKDDMSVSLTVGSDKLYKNGKEITLDVPAKIVGGRMLVPVRAVAESFDCGVDWSGGSRTVIITE